MSIETCTCSISDTVNMLLNEIEMMDMPQKVAAINNVKRKLHAISPFANEPVDCSCGFQLKT